MRRFKLSGILAFWVILVAVVAAYSDVLHLQVPQDIEPPVYTSAAGPAFQPDGSIFAVHTSAWAAIPFWRSPDCIRTDFNLLEQVDVPAAFGCQLLVKGSVDLETDNGNLLSWIGQEVNTVPVWFVRWPSLRTAVSDNVLTMAELSTMDSLVKGQATTYRERNYTVFSAQGSHLLLRAAGALEDGRPFRLHAVEVGLSLMYVDIDF